MEDIHLGALMNAVLFACTGLLLFGAAFTMAGKLYALDFRKEILERGNVAVAVLLAGVAIGLALIISSTFH